MQRHAVKTYTEREDAEAERLVRKSPKLKPPRRDRRREDMQPDKGRPQTPQGDKIPVINRETQKRVYVSPSTLKENPGKYEKVKEGTPTSPEDSESSHKSAPEQEPSGVSVPKDFWGGGETDLGQDSKGPSHKSAPEQEPSEVPASKEESSEVPASKEEKKEKKKPTPSVSEKEGIQAPKRREVSKEEYAKVSLALADALPPQLAAQLIATRIHPDDAQDLLSYYKAAQTRQVGDISTYVEKVSSVYQTNLDRVESPSTGLNSKGQRVSFDKLTPEEKSEAYRKHQMQVVAVSVAAKEQLSSKIGTLAPKSIADSLADSLLFKEVNSKKVAAQVYKTVVKSGTVHPFTLKQGRQLLALVESSPGASTIAKSFLEANDYVQVKADLLKSGAITENSPSDSIIDGLRTARRRFEERAEVYGLGVHRGSERFQRKVLEQLKSLDPAKYSEVRKAFDQIERLDYEKAEKAYKKALRKWQSQSVSDRGQPPTPPVRPIGLSSTKSKKELAQDGRSLWKDLFGEGSAKIASSVTYRYLISTYLDDRAMGCQFPVKSRVGLYHGIDPSVHYPQGPYRGWGQAHQRDLGESDYSLILRSAEEWLKSSVLRPAEGMLPDQRFRHALDLAIHNSPYNRAIDAPTYNRLLDRLQGPGLPKYALDRSALEKKVYSKFPSDSRMKRGGRLQVMLTGTTASRLKRDDYSLVYLDELSAEDLSALAKVFKVHTASMGTNQGFRASRSWDHNVKDRNGEKQMLILASDKKAKANEILGRMDAIAKQIQEKYASWGLSQAQAKHLVNTIDKVADETEAFIFGEQSLLTRQAEIAVTDSDFAREARETVGSEVFAKAAAVLQRDPDEAYMDTFMNPHQPHQTDADEPYMSAYTDDQSSAVGEGEDDFGRELAPEY